MFAVSLVMMNLTLRVKISLVSHRDISSGWSRVRVVLIKSNRVEMGAKDL